MIRDVLEVGFEDLVEEFGASLVEFDIVFGEEEGLEVVGVDTGVEMGFDGFGSGSRGRPFGRVLGVAEGFYDPSWVGAVLAEARF
jgi:hypothetical protein